MTIDDVWQQVCEHPDDDEPRLRYATLIEPSDPEWAAFIRTQIDQANQRRRGVEYVTFSEPRHKSRWARNLLPYVSRGSLNCVEFFRGFPTWIKMHPAMFPEYADLLFRLAPIQHIDFCTPYDEDFEIERDELGRDAVIPLDSILACPQLARLDSLGFIKVRLGNDWGKRLAACPHLTRCLYLDLRFSSMIEEDVIALAEGPLTGKMIGLRGNRVGDGFGESVKYGKGSVREHTYGGPETTRYYYGEGTKELERRLGYIPWLHNENRPSRYDLRWYVEHGKVPKFPAGSLPPKDEWYELPPPVRHPRTW